MTFRTRWLVVALVGLIAFVATLSTWSYVVARRTAVRLAGPLPEGFVLAGVGVVLWPLPPIEERQLAWRFTYRRGDMIDGGVLLFVSTTGELLEKTSRAPSYVAPRSNERWQLAEQTQRVAGAERVMAAYLWHSAIENSEAVPDSLWTHEEGCLVYSDPGGGLRALATHRILSSYLAGDTAIVDAEVTSAARVEGRRDGLHVVQGVVVDTLSWDLPRTTTSTGWAVCGDSRENVGFMRLKYFGASGEFWDDGATYASVLALADSIRAAKAKTAAPKQ